MHMRMVEMRNWRSYRHARFEFPVPDGARNVILIRGANENGKTTLFEAIAFGLFGRAGLSLTPRAAVLATTADTHRQFAVSYSKFLAGALHHRAIALGQQNCSVTIEFEDVEGEPLEIKRTWFFAANGDHRPADDQLSIFEGRGRRPVRAPVITVNHDEWYLDFIGQKLIPHHLAEFFLFDGEQVQRYAERSMTEQIRSGMEGLLGLRVLRSLRESLRKYARATRSKTISPTNTQVAKIGENIESLEKEIDEKTESIAEVSRPLPDLEAEHADIVRRIGSGEGTTARVGQLIQEEERFRAEAERRSDQLVKLLSSDVALALSGDDLRRSTIARLQQEDVRERWESAKSEGSANLERYLEDLSSRLKLLDPPVPAEREETIIAAARDAWAALWYPAPDGCADGYRHSGMKGSIRARALGRLEEASRQSVGELATSVTRFRDAVDTAENRKQQRLQIEAIVPEIEHLTQRLAAVNERMGKIKSQRESAERSKRSLEGELDERRREHARIVELGDRDAPARRRAESAEAYADLVGEILRDAVPSQVGSVAKAMTTAWKSMAQMEERVDRIEIDETCQVRMLNRNNEDIHVIEKSAGAKQIFTQALIRAITQVSGIKFPFVVDTPMARLSKEHRFGILNTFVNREGQVILLCTDTEIVGDELDKIRNRILVTYALHLRHDDGVSVTEVDRSAARE